MNRRTFISTASAVTAAGATALAKSPSLPSKIIDVHTHFYDTTRSHGVSWPRDQKDEVLFRPVLPPEFEPLTRPFNVKGTVIVEASTWIEDNAWILELAADNPFIKGFVGSLDPSVPHFEYYLDRFSANPLYRGIRLRGVTLRDVRDLLGPLERRKLTVDFLGGNDMLLELPYIAKKFPELTMVIDHLPFDPPSDPAQVEAVQQAFAALANHPNVIAKVSNVPRRKEDVLITDAAFYKERLDFIWETFGEDRVMYASNWPVSDHVANYGDQLMPALNYVNALGETAVEKYYWRNSKRVYGWLDRA
ncbi:MAG: L-fuconolactonase [Kiritimatiellia bacterium]|jgi:L-fuconolactonase